MADSRSGAASPPIHPETADRLEKVIGRLVKASPGRDVLRRTALVHIGKPYDSFATLLVASVYDATFEAAPYVPTSTEGLQAVALDLASAIEELERIRTSSGISPIRKQKIAEARLALIGIVNLIDDAKRPGLSRRTRKA